MIRIFNTLIYTILILALTGIPELALAAISCNDRIYTGTNYKYSDALTLFIYYNGNTYAIAKSAVTGVLTQPDGYFDFIANIDSEYATTGVDHSSLQRLFTSGIYGDAYPVTITSADVQQFIVNTYGSLMGEPTSLRSTYVNAWKGYGAMQPYVQMTGGLLPFTNWSSGQAPNINTVPPQAVTMGSSGAWINGQDGKRTAQVVEFIGQQLDCALNVTPVTPPGPLPPSGMICGHDLNGNGNIDPNETAPCVSTVQGPLCPVGAVNCTDNTSAPICPTGSTLDNARDMCQADPTVICGAGYTWDATVDRCVAPVTCPDGGTFNANANRCEKLVQNDCPTGYTYDANRAICWMAVNCGPGAVFSSARDRCERLPTWDCPTGFTYNGIRRRCESYPICPPQTSYNGATNRCVTALTPCPTGYTYNTVLNLCVVDATCTNGGVLNSATDQCEVAISTSCPVGGWVYNSAAQRCERPPFCVLPGTYDNQSNLCTTPAWTPSCSSGYTYNTTLQVCVAAPVCSSGSYNSTNNRCEAAATYSCPDSTYTYNSATTRCEKPPVCSQGAYNSTYNKCLQNYTPSCQAGYIYNVNRLRCEMAPQCTTGTFNAVTNKCEWPAVSYYPATIISYSCPVGAGVLNGAFCYTQCRGYAIKGSYVIYAGCGWACNESYGPHSLPNGTYPMNYGPALVVNNNDPPRATCNCYANPGGNCLMRSVVSVMCMLSPIRDREYFDASCNMLEGVTYPPGTCWTGPSDDTTNVNFRCNISAGTAATPIYACNAGDTLVGSTCSHNNTGQANPTCPNGTFDPTYHNCYSAYTPGCPVGTTYDAASNQCSIDPTCTNGILDTTADRCYQSSTGGCQSGYTIAGSICYGSPTCTGGGTFNAAIDYCSMPGVGPLCPAGGYLYSSTNNNCYLAPDCTPGSLNATSDVCLSTYSASCPTGYTQSGMVCQSAPSCATGGTYNVSVHRCSASGSLCTPPWQFDAATDTCFQLPNCAPGWFDAPNDVCVQPSTSNCSGWTWDPSAAQCYSPPVCTPGAYDNVSQECHASVTLNCGTYLWSPADSRCVATIVCPTDVAFPLNQTIAFSPLLDECVSDAQHNCPTGLSYITLPVEKCEAVPVCNGGTYDTTLNACTSGKSCPLGSQYNCMDNQGVFQCSANQCFNPDNPPWTVVPPVPFDETMLQDDARNPDGSCGGTLMIFNGKASRCRPPGIDVGMLNNCCQGDVIVPEDVGNGLMYGYKTIQTIWDLCQIGYYSYMASLGQVNIISELVNGVYQSTIIVMDGTGAVISAVPLASFSAPVQAGIQAGVQTGSAVAGTTAYYMQMISYYAVVISAVMFVVMQILYGSGCDTSDVQTASQIATHQCHYVGDYCQIDTIFGCWQRANTYCCFNSMMARIIQEQGRPQLAAYGPTGSWGNAQAPNCRGLIPEEFEALDFSKIDFSEYIAQIQLNLNAGIQNAHDKIQGNIQGRVQQIQNP